MVEEKPENPENQNAIKKIGPYIIRSYMKKTRNGSSRDTDIYIDKSHVITKHSLSSNNKANWDDGLSDNTVLMDNTSLTLNSLNRGNHRNFIIKGRADRKRHGLLSQGHVKPNFRRVGSIKDSESKKSNFYFNNKKNECEPSFGL